MAVLNHKLKMAAMTDIRAAQPRRHAMGRLDQEAHRALRGAAARHPDRHRHFKAVNDR
jgi:hypothetical protein